MCHAAVALLHGETLHLNSPVYMWTDNDIHMGGRGWCWIYSINPCPVRWGRNGLFFRSTYLWWKKRKVGIGAKPCMPTPLSIPRILTQERITGLGKSVVTDVKVKPRSADFSRKQGRAGIVKSTVFKLGPFIFTKRCTLRGHHASISTFFCKFLRLKSIYRIICIQ